MKKVTVTFEDDDSLTIDEIKSNLRSTYGQSAEINVTPATKSPTSYIQFGIESLITKDQAQIFFDQPELYQTKLKELRHAVHKQLQYILNDVIMDNEERFCS